MRCIARARERVADQGEVGAVPAVHLQNDCGLIWPYDYHLKKESGLTASQSLCAPFELSSLHLSARKGSAAAGVGDPPLDQLVVEPVVSPLERAKRERARHAHLRFR